MRAKSLSNLPARPFQLSLHVRHPSIDPAEISRELACLADESFRAGEPRKSRSGVAATSVYAETYWAAALNPAFWTVGRAALQDRRSQLKQLIARGKGQGYLTRAQLKDNLPAEITAAAEIADVVDVLAGMGIPLRDDVPTLSSAPAQLTPREAKVLQMRAAFETNSILVGNLDVVLALVCGRLKGRHTQFLDRVRAEGGRVRLLVTLTPKAVRGFNVVPDVSRCLSALGIHLEFEFTG